MLVTAVNNSLTEEQCDEPFLSLPLSISVDYLLDVNGAYSVCIDSRNEEPCPLVQWKTATIPTVAHDPACFTKYEQMVWKTSVGNNANGSGAPAFIFEHSKANTTDPAAMQIP
jgi:hypothetical protein